MNLHEESLLKYLLNPKRLLDTPELLKSNNFKSENNLLGLEWQMHKFELNSLV